MTKRTVIARMTRGLGRDTELMVAVDASGKLDVRIAHDINGLSVFMPTSNGLTVPLAALPDLIVALQRAQADLATRRLADVIEKLSGESPPEAA